MGCFNTEKLWDTFFFLFLPSTTLIPTRMFSSPSSPPSSPYIISAVWGPPGSISTFLSFLPSPCVCLPLFSSPNPHGLAGRALMFLPSSTSFICIEADMHRPAQKHTYTRSCQRCIFLPSGLYWSCCQVSSNPPTQIHAHKPHQQCNSTVDRSWVHVKDACVAFRVWKPPTSQSPSPSLYMADKLACLVHSWLRWF